MSLKHCDINSNNYEIGSNTNSNKSYIILLLKIFLEVEIMFILEEAINKVENKKIYFLLMEVTSSYYQGNYRSAIVVTHTAIIMNLLDKLSDLATIYQDKTAQKILDEVRVKRENDLYSSAWETVNWQ